VCALCGIKVLILFFIDVCFLKICYEFDFVREASAMERIREFLRITNKKPPVMVPRVIPGMVTRYYIIEAHLTKMLFRLFN
jgi:predicted unusual protein kinase regulating ubiquinone biosynthesis (AarF/ABC1/UbiB family)